MVTAQVQRGCTASTTGYSLGLSQIREKADKKTLWKWDKWGGIGVFTCRPEGAHPVPSDGGITG